ncbi:MAG: TolC family protein [Myxococcales bacterium]|nr:TolC family protein [Myxococcales bacterium]
MPKPLKVGAALALAVVLSQAAWAEPPAPLLPVNAATDMDAAALAARRPVLLKEALLLAEKKNPDLAAARATAAQVSAKASLVYSSILPDLTLSASYVYTSAPAVFDQSGQTQLLSALTTFSNMPPELKAQTLAGLAEAPAVMEIQAANSLFGSLVLQQVLFTPQLFLLPAAEEAEEAANLGALEAREQILLAVTKVYLGIEGLGEIAAAAKEAEAIAQKREKDAAAQVQLGTATDIAVLRAQQELSQSRATLANIAGQRVALLMLLETMVGEPVRPLEGRPTQYDVTPADEASQPWEKVYSVQASAMALKSQERFNTFDRLSWMPSVVAQAKGSYNSNKGFVNTNWIFDGIIAAQWQLYDRGVRDVNRRENDAKTVEFRAKLEGARARARANWYSAKTNLLTAQVALEQAEATQRLATRAQKQAEAAFQVGFSTGLEVSEIDSRRFLAASAAAQARAQMQLRKVELLAAEGRLAEVVGVTTPPKD